VNFVFLVGPELGMDCKGREMRVYFVVWRICGTRGLRDLMGLEMEVELDERELERELE
jgi:hypothetical protein